MQGRSCWRPCMSAHTCKRVCFRARARVRFCERLLVSARTGGSQASGTDGRELPWPAWQPAKESCVPRVNAARGEEKPVR
eukprot:3383296-Alexandrium_andersonii.AAC.1